MKYKYYDILMAAFVTVLLTSNLVGAPKVCTVWGFTFGAGVLFFPISYLFGDILTEVYGYARSRKVVWAGFGAMIFTASMTEFVRWLPGAESWENGAAYETIFATAPRVAMASLIAYLVGEFMNSYVLAKMKVWSEGQHLWMRTIGSTIIGEAIDSVIFYPVAFLGIWSDALVMEVMISNYIIKVIWEILMTPFTYKLVGFLKRAEKVDHYDRKTNFNPFSLKTD
jgi:queuosine precursor transporter